MLLARFPTLKPKLTSFLRNVNLTDRKALMLCLSIGFFVRLIPEILAFPLPIGFDTIHYAATMKSGVVWTDWSTVFTSSWLLYSLLIPLYMLVPIDPFMLLKIIAPLLFGLNVAGIYWFSRKMLGWNLPMGLLAGGFFALQLASLRISWDLLRNTLGLGILLFTLPFINEVNSKRGFALFVLLSLLTVFAHEYAAVILFVIVLGLFVGRIFKRNVDFASKRLILAVLPALGVFSSGIFLRMFQVGYASQTNVIWTSDAITTHPYPLFFLVDYLHVQSFVYSYPSYWNLAFSVGLLFVVLYLPYIFLVVKGFFKNSILSLWTGILLIGAFSCLIVPFFALEYWYRWMFMLVYPFTFYAVKGIDKLTSKLSGKKKDLPALFTNKKVVVIVALTFSLAIAYLATPMSIAYTNENLPSFTGNGRYFSTIPTVPYKDVNSLTQSMNWLNENMGDNSCVILQRTFLSWGQLYLDTSHTIVDFELNANLAIQTAYEHDFSHVYFICWNKSTIWYGVSVREHFVMLQNFGDISVCELKGENSIGN
jgi:hypothetical protein